MGTKTAITWEEFLASAVEGQKCEWVDGEVVQMSPVNLPHERILALLIEYLVDFCRISPEWLRFPSNGVFTMASGNWRLPDASLLRKDRFPGGRVTVNVADFAPDVAFEILSRSNTPSYIQRKRKDYQESGVIQVWIDPDLRLVKSCTPIVRPAIFSKGSGWSSRPFRSSPWISTPSLPCSVRNLGRLAQTFRSAN